MTALAYHRHNGKNKNKSTILAPRRKAAKKTEQKDILAQRRGDAEVIRTRYSAGTTISSSLRPLTALAYHRHNGKNKNKSTILAPRRKAAKKTEQKDILAQRRGDAEVIRTRYSAGTTISSSLRPLTALAYHRHNGKNKNKSTILAPRRKAAKKTKQKDILAQRRGDAEKTKIVFCKFVFPINRSPFPIYRSYRRRSRLSGIHRLLFTVHPLFIVPAKHRAPDYR